MKLIDEKELLWFIQTILATKKGVELDENVIRNVLNLQLDYFDIKGLTFTITKQ